MSDYPQFSGKSYLSGEPLPLKLSEGVQDYHKIYTKFVKDARKKGKTFNYVDPTVLKAEIAAQMHSATDFVEKRFPQLHKLYEDITLAKKTYNLEKGFKEFFDEVSGEGSHDWKLFFSKENGEYVWTERSCGIFGNLATIYRQRGSYAACDEVMVPYTYVIQNYEAMVRARTAEGKSDNDELVCCRQLVMKYHRIAVNLAVSLKRTKGMPVSYRHLINFELDVGVANTDNDEFAWMMEAFLMRRCTKQNLALTTDAELLKMVQMFYAMQPTVNAIVPNEPLSKEEFERIHPGERYGGNVHLAQCAACSATEPFLNTYKLCARCKSVKYCGRDCQLAHHQTHKGPCKKIASEKNNA